MLITWQKPLDNGIKPRLKYPRAQEIIWVLGGMHNFFSTCVLISYFITNRPTFPNIKSFLNKKLSAKNLQAQLRKLSDQQEEDEELDQQFKPTKNHLEVKFFSFKTMWYLLICVFSWLGTYFFGYFFIFHLLHLAQFNQLLKRTIMAVQKNGNFI